MKVWRVEDADGVGMHSKLVAAYDPDYDLRVPTAFNMAISDWCPFDDDVRAQVPPDDDERLQVELARTGQPLSEYLFGFASARQMREYLYRDSWILRLESFGMFVSIYWVEDGAVIGDHQVLLPKGLAPLDQYRIGVYFGLSAE
jgi:hypothetical protein